MIIMPSKLDNCWTAGLLDADGCITIVQGSKGFRSPLVIVDNTDREIIDTLVEMHGGSVVKKKKAKRHHRQAWSWRVKGAHKVSHLLRKVLPHMRCQFKCARGRMLIEDYPRVTPRNGRYTPEQRKQKIEFERRFLALGGGRGSRNRAK